MIILAELAGLYQNKSINKMTGPYKILILNKCMGEYQLQSFQVMKNTKVRYIMLFVLLQICECKQQQQNQSLNSSLDQSILIPVLIFGAFFIFTNGIILFCVCRQRRKYKVDTTVTRMHYYEQMPNITFEPHPADSCCDQRRDRKPFLSRNCFHPKDTLTQIPCYIIEDEVIISPTKVIVNCTRCPRVTSTICISQFGKSNIPYICWCFLIFFVIPWPALLYAYFSKQVIWRGYFCECGLQKEVIETSND